MDLFNGSQSDSDSGFFLLRAVAIFGILFIIGIMIAGAFTLGIFSGKFGDVLQKPLIGGHRDKIAVISIDGSMVADKSTDEKKVACSSDIVRKLRKATDDEDVKAVVLRINSPGGTPVAAEEIISQVEKTKRYKPVVVSMGDIATSAAYYVSSSADKIYANPDTFTGSIGVIWVFKNKTRYYDEEGINFYIAKSGNFKDVGADWRGLSDGEKAYVQSIINESYDRFVSNVATGRNISETQIRSIADGRVYTGYRAKEIGLVDELGGLYDAVNMAATLADIKGKPEIVYYNETYS